MAYRYTTSTGIGGTYYGPSASTRSYGSGASVGSSSRMEPVSYSRGLASPYAGRSGYTPATSSSSRYYTGAAGSDFDTYSSLGRRSSREPSPAAPSYRGGTSYTPYSSYSSRYGPGPSGNVFSDRDLSRYGGSTVSSRDSREGSAAYNSHRPPYSRQSSGGNSSRVAELAAKYTSSRPSGASESRRRSRDEEGRSSRRRSSREDAELGISASRNRHFPRSNVRIEIDGKVLVGEAAPPMTVDCATQTMDDIFLPPPNRTSGRPPICPAQPPTPPTPVQQQPASPTAGVMAGPRRLSGEDPHRRSGRRSDRSSGYGGQDTMPLLPEDLSCASSIEKVNDWRRQQIYHEEANRPRSPRSASDGRREGRRQRSKDSDTVFFPDSDADDTTIRSDERQKQKEQQKKLQEQQRKQQEELQRKQQEELQRKQQEELQRKQHLEQEQKLMQQHKQELQKLNEQQQKQQHQKLQQQQEREKLRQQQQQEYDKLRQQQLKEHQEEMEFQRKMLQKQQAVEVPAAVEEEFDEDAYFRQRAAQRRTTAAKDSPDLSSHGRKDKTDYVGGHTDIDALLCEKFPHKNRTTQHTARDAMKLLQKQGSLLYDEYYTGESDDDSAGGASESEEALTLVFKCRRARDIFEKMPIQLQHMIVRGQGKKIKFASLLYFCRNANYGRRFTDAEEKHFRGYRSVDEMLEDCGLNILKLEDCILQLYRFNKAQGDFGSYLDLELSIDEQWEEFEGFDEHRKNAVILRTKLCVRVHAIIEKLLNASGRELRRALFSLKQIFQDDKDLVHEFVTNDGLDCLIKVGSEADQNYQNYILRALGQVMLYVDGMNGVIEHPKTVQWLYSLLSSKFRLVVKTALKLLLVFVEYSENNALLFVNAVLETHKVKGGKDWAFIMSILNEQDGTDTELLTYTMTLINRTLNAVPDADTFYDVTDAMEEQGIQRVVQRYMERQGADIDLVEQFQIYEAALKFEDGEEELPVSRESLRLVPRAKTESSRKSKRVSLQHQQSPLSAGLMQPKMSLPEADRHPRIEDRRGLRRRRTHDREALDQLSASGMEEEGTPPPSEADRVRRQLRPEHRGQPSGQEDDPTSDKKWMVYRRSQSTEKEPAKGAGQEEPRAAPTGDRSGLISAAKESLGAAVAAANAAPGRPEAPDEAMAGAGAAAAVPKSTILKSESELQWEELETRLNRSLKLKDLDFTDLGSEDEEDCTMPPKRPVTANGIGPPPPPPPPGGGLPPPPPPPPGPGRGPGAPPPPPPPPGFGKPPAPPGQSSKMKKTIRLHWRDLRHDLAKPVPNGKVKETVWLGLAPVRVDSERMESLFENKVSEIKIKRTEAGPKKIEVLDFKRSNAINIGMTVLPPPRTIKNAILKMDSSIINKEGIEKLLTTMMPSEEEVTMIVDAQMANPEAPLGSAEQFLLTLSSITELRARLELWLFKLDYDNTEQEVSEPLMDLKQGIEELQKNETFKNILSAVLAIGNFLNGSAARGFNIDYLARVPEVKDTMHKHSLLYHVCNLVLEQFPNSTDLYSEIGSISRCARVDWDELRLKIERLETECKRSWDNLRAIVKHEAGSGLKQNDYNIKMSEFLTDAAERIILLKIIHRRVMNRFLGLLLYLGVPASSAKEQKVSVVCKTVSEFALEYRTTRDKLMQQLIKKANARERKKTRGKLIVDLDSLKPEPSPRRETSVSSRDEDQSLFQVLSGRNDRETESPFNSFQRHRRSQADSLRRNSRSSMPRSLGNLATGNDSDHIDTEHDEILEACVKSATAPNRRKVAPKERKRALNRDRKSLRRTLVHGMTEDELNAVQAYVQG